MVNIVARKNKGEKKKKRKRGEREEEEGKGGEEKEGKRRGRRGEKRRRERRGETVAQPHHYVLCSNPPLVLIGRLSALAWKRK